MRSLLMVSVLGISLFTGCALIRKAVGADMDPERYALAREAAMLDLRERAAAALAQRLAAPDPPERAELVVFLSPGAVDSACAQLLGAKGKLDEATAYVVRRVTVTLVNGAAVASLSIDARNDDYDVDVALMMDCILAVFLEKDRFVARLEPFNISPDVSAKGLLAPASGIIRDVLKKKLAGIGRDLPPIVFPVDIAGSIPLEGTAVRISEGVNAVLQVPRRLVDCRVRIKEVLVFESGLLVAVDLSEVRVR
ncbi:MAG: hypothetical protein QHI48_10250 [Bacteroidota bacterium]|nr:hypothetical protein [Bacteroidota bacterium]